MPRVSVRRLFVYAIYTVVVTSLVMLALHVQQQNPLWLRVLEQSSGPGGYYQQNSKEVDEEAPAHFVVVNNDEKTTVDNVTTDNINPLRSHGLPWYIKNDGYRPSQGDVVDNIWPDGRLNGDRIEQQLMVPTRDADGISGEGSSLLAGAVKPLKKIFLPNGLGSWQTKSGQKVFTEQKCPVDRCSLTSNREEASNADAIMFKDFFATPSHQRPPHQIWIMYMLECPLHTQYVREKDVFNWTATYKSDSELVTPYEKWVYYDDKVRRKPVTTNFAANKTKKVAWFVSNCGAKNNRLEYAHNLQKHIEVDIYGSCGTKNCPRHSGDHCLDILSKEYKFYLAFENSNCRDYITEKFYVNGLGSKVLPIVMGAPRADYEKHAPEHSFIHVDDFASPKELADYLHQLDSNDTLYNEYFEWRETGQFINTYFFCRLCAMLHEAPHSPARSYEDFNEWWRGGTNCIKGSWRDLEIHRRNKKKKMMQLKQATS
ncbi:glycoprotein 3-alpha-L-fucosyltransferase A-like [Daphnia carinata]|uniref:glycoprotein 3-alpha-L-fucosyltransferase A-like n=1 Tax=Daphnia carinata TaxID=120202 RepID=UPI0025794DA0|nr:glycoprotein 3-alpha-L-fucosyltransferase A-like [Daphnia carinata]